MRITTVSITYSRKINLGDYESAELGCSLWAQVDDDEEAEAVTQFLYLQAKTSVKEAAMPLIQASSYQMQKAQMYKQTAKQNAQNDLENF
jgi:hypothetical protein